MPFRLWFRYMAKIVEASIFCMRLTEIDYLIDRLNELGFTSA